MQEPVANPGAKPAARAAAGGRRARTKIQQPRDDPRSRARRLCRDRLRRGHRARHHPRDAARLGHLLQLLQVQGRGLPGHSRRHRARHPARGLRAERNKAATAEEFLSGTFHTFFDFVARERVNFRHLRHGGDAGADGHARGDRRASRNCARISKAPSPRGFSRRSMPIS